MYTPDAAQETTTFSTCYFNAIVFAMLPTFFVKVFVPEAVFFGHRPKRLEMTEKV